MNQSEWMTQRARSSISLQLLHGYHEAFVHTVHRALEWYQTQWQQQTHNRMQQLWQWTLGMSLLQTVVGTPYRVTWQTYLKSSEYIMWGRGAWTRFPGTEIYSELKVCCDSWCFGTYSTFIGSPFLRFVFPFTIEKFFHNTWSVLRTSVVVTSLRSRRSQLSRRLKEMLGSFPAL